MKQFKIKYQNKNSEIERHVCYCLGESDLNATLVDLIIDGNFIDWLGEKEAGDKLMQFWEISYVGILRELNVLEKDEQNREQAYEEWGY